MATKKTQTNETDAALSLASKWGKNLMASGWTALPNVVIRNQKALGLKQLDILVLLHLASYWRKATDLPRPSKKTIAETIDVDPRTVQRSVKKMEELGYVQRKPRKGGDTYNLPNEYDLSGLVNSEKVKQLVEEELNYRQEASEVRNERVKEMRAKRETPQAYALTKSRGTAK